MALMLILIMLQYKKRHKRCSIVEKQTIYVYLIRDGKVVQDICECEVRGKYTYRMTDRKRNAQIIDVGQLDKCERNRIVSFEDNLPKFRQLLIEDYERKVEETTKRLKQQVDILNSIKRD